MARQLGSLPFSARVGLPDTVRPARLDVAISGTDSGATLELTGRAFSSFTVAADAGMFAGESVPPVESKFTVVSHELAAAVHSYHCEVRGVDPGAFRILLNVLAESCRRSEPLGEVRLTGQVQTDRLMELEAVLLRRYPGRAQTVPFELRLREFFYENREPLIRMEFRRALDDEEFEQIKTMLQAWDSIVVLGGYLEISARDDEIMPEAGELFMAEPTVLEHLLYGFQGPEETFNAVINLAVRVHATICQLVSLEIE